MKNQMKLALFLLALGFASGLPTNGTKSKETTLEKQELEREQSLSPMENGSNDFLDGLVEVKENEIPEGALVYVVEEHSDPSTDGETMHTANNIVFRPLFHYRNKQATLARRRSSAARRRYYVSRRPYRQAYYYPRYRRYRYY